MGRHRKRHTGVKFPAKRAKETFMVKVAILNSDIEGNEGEQIVVIDMAGKSFRMNWLNGLSLMWFGLRLALFGESGFELDVDDLEVETEI